MKIKINETQPLFILDEAARMFITSTNISAIEYDEVNERLTIEFLNGREYEYYDVPENVYKQLIASPSKGQFFHKNIRGNYNYREVAKDHRDLVFEGKIK